MAVEHAAESTAFTELWTNTDALLALPQSHVDLVQVDTLLHVTPPLHVQTPPRGLSSPTLQTAMHHVRQLAADAADAAAVAAATAADFDCAEQRQLRAKPPGELPETAQTSAAGTVRAMHDCSAPRSGAFRKLTGA